MLPLALAGCLAIVAPALADDHRIVVGESVTVGPDEVLDRVTCLFCSVHVEGVVRDSAFVILGELENRGTIDGDALVILGAMRLNGDVGGDATAVLADIDALAEEVAIGGNAVTVLGTTSGLSPDNVGGEIDQIGGEQVGQVFLAGLLIGLFLVGLIVLIVLTAVNLITYVALGPERVQTIAGTLSGSLIACFLGGVCTCFALLLVGFIVAMILPVSLPMVLVFVVVSAVGYCGVTHWIGSNLFFGRAQLTGTVAASTLVVILQMIPVVGWLITLVLWNIAIGAAVLSGFGTSTDWLSSRTSAVPQHRSTP